MKPTAARQSIPILLLAMAMAVALAHSEAGAQILAWKRVNGIPGGAVHAIVLDSSGNTFAASEAGVYRSIDDGRSWGDNIFPRQTSIIEMAADRDGRLYAIEERNTDRNRLLRSASHGTTWEMIDSASMPSLVHLAVLPTGIIIGIDDQGDIYRSLDHGERWIRAGDSSTAASLALVTPSGRIYANDYARILRSTDQGASWTVLEEDLPFADINAVVEMPDGRIFAATGEGLYGSRDDGMHWKLAQTGQVEIEGFPRRDRNARALTLTSSGRLVAEFLGYEDDPAHNYIVVSDDAGDHWSLLDSSIAVVSELDNGVFSTGFVAGPNGRIYTGVEDDGIYMSEDDGRSWDQVDWSFSNNDIWQMETDREGRLFAVSADNFYRTDDGIHWKKLSHRGTTPFAVAPNGDIMARSYFDIEQQVTRSTDHGDTWDSLGTRQPNNVTAVAFNRGGDIFLGLEANAILRSTDNGSSWQTRGDRSIPAGLTIRDLVINARGDLFASTFRGTGGSAMPALYRSTDSGATWAKVFDSVGIALLAIGPRDEIYFTSSGWSSPIYRSSDNGESFRKINPPSGYQDIFNAIAVDEQGHLFLGTRDNGILLSVDSGATWMAQNMGLPGRNAQLIATGPGDRVYIDVAGKLFRAETEMLSVDEGPATGGMALGAEPNPTRGETVIRFPLRSAAHVTLEIHDANGRLVASLIDGGLEAGEHAVIWEGAGNPSGVYTVTLRAGALLRSARLILLK